MDKRWRKFMLGALLLLAVPGLLLGGGAFALNNASANRIGNPSMLDATPEEIGNAAIEYTRQNLEILSGTPQILLNRLVTPTEAPDLVGLISIGYSLDSPPWRLVILKGDFDVSDLPGGLVGPNHRLKATYIAYIYDLRAGEPTLIETSLTGGIFRKALNDPTLPDDNPPVTPDPSYLDVPIPQPYHP